MKPKWFTTMMICLTQLTSIAMMIYLIRSLIGQNQTHQDQLMSLITGKAYESPPPTRTISTPSSSAEVISPLEALSTQFDGLPQEAQQAAMREYAEYMAEQQMWKEPDPRVPAVIPGEPIPLQWNEMPSSP